jgi:hypothetical protein
MTHEVHWGCCFSSPLLRKRKINFLSQANWTLVDRNGKVIESGRTDGVVVPATRSDPRVPAMIGPDLFERLGEPPQRSQTAKLRSLERGSASTHFRDYFGSCSVFSIIIAFDAVARYICDRRAG